jgi:hypothetical protein
MNARNVLFVFMLFGARGTVGQPSSSPVSEMTVVGICVFSGYRREKIECLPDHAWPTPRTFSTA